jgi:hypothetical protein
MGDMIGVTIFIVLIIIAIFVIIARWIFRINDIINRLDKIVMLLDGKTEGPKTFMDGFRKGMKE